MNTALQLTSTGCFRPEIDGAGHMSLAVRPRATATYSLVALVDWFRTSDQFHISHVYHDIVPFRLRFSITYRQKF